MSWSHAACSTLEWQDFSTLLKYIYVYNVISKVIHYRTDASITKLIKLFIKQNEGFLVVVRFEDPIMILGPTNYSTVALYRRFYMCMTS